MLCRNFKQDAGAGRLALQEAQLVPQSGWGAPTPPQVLMELLLSDQLEAKIQNKIRVTIQH